MLRHTFSSYRWYRLLALLAASGSALLLACPAWAASPIAPQPGKVLTLPPPLLQAADTTPLPPHPTASLSQTFAAAWARQPEALSQAERDQADAAQAEAAQRWTAEPPALALAHQTDQATGRKQGQREWEIGIALPLWLPGERELSQALAETARALTISRVREAQWRTAGQVRERYWQAQATRIDFDLSHDHLQHARQLAADVARRVKAGDLAPLDQHQAEAAIASAQAAHAEALAAWVGAVQALHALSPVAESPAASAAPPRLPEAEALPPPTPANETSSMAHPALAALQAQGATARHNAALARLQSRANPELSLSATRERGQAGEPYQHSLTLGLRIPLGAGAAHQSRLAAAEAEATEADARLALARTQVQADQLAARWRHSAAQSQWQAAEEKQRLARMTRQMLHKSIQLGETDLPTRLRSERETFEAERQAAKARIDLSAAISALRQALGLLPE